MPIPERPAVNDDLQHNVRLSERDVRAAARLFRTLSAVVGYAPEAEERSDEPPSEDDLVSRARIIIHSRQARLRYFKRGIFGEPAWDILLLLYVDGASGPRQTVTNLARWIDTPPTTVIRWLAYLEGEGLVERFPHPNDKRTTFIRLLDKGRQAMRQYLGDAAWPPNA